MSFERNPDQRSRTRRGLLCTFRPWSHPSGPCDLEGTILSSRADNAPPVLPGTTAPARRRGVGADCSGGGAGDLALDRHEGSRRANVRGPAARSSRAPAMPTAPRSAPRLKLPRSCSTPGPMHAATHPPEQARYPHRGEMAKRPVRTLERVPASATQPDPLGLVRAYRWMLVARQVDDTMWTLRRQGKGPLRGVLSRPRGHRRRGRPGRRPRAGLSRPALPRPDRLPRLGPRAARGHGPLLWPRGRPVRGGRQPYAHWGSTRRRILSQEGPQPNVVTHAVGVAFANRRLGSPAVVWIAFGDGGAQKGEVHEAMNFASIHRLPVVFCVQNNLYTQSVPLRLESSVADLSLRAAGYGMPGVSVDGMDLLAVYPAARAAVERARAGEGPSLIEARAYRYMPNTSNDDDTRYRSREEVETWRKRDPIARLRSHLLASGALTEQPPPTSRLRSPTRSPKPRHGPRRSLTHRPKTRSCTPGPSARCPPSAGCNPLERLSPNLSRQAPTLACAWLAAVNARAPLLTLGPLLPLVIHDLHLSFTVAGVLSGLPLFLMGATGLPGGWLTDRFGARHLMIWGLGRHHPGRRHPRIGPERAGFSGRHCPARPGHRRNAAGAAARRPRHAATSHHAGHGHLLQRAGVRRRRRRGADAASAEHRGKLARRAVRVGSCRGARRRRLDSLAPDPADRRASRSATPRRHHPGPETARHGRVDAGHGYSRRAWSRRSCPAGSNRPERWNGRART